jgi:hypothetical protein
MASFSPATRTYMTQQNVDESILRGFIGVFPGLRYDEDRASGRIPVPFLEESLYVEVLLDPSAQDRFRVQTVERHQTDADSFVRTSAGYSPLASNDNRERSEAGPELISLSEPFAPGVAGGLIGDITEFVLATSLSPVREFATMSAVSFLATLFGRRAITPTGAGLNIYCACVAPSGMG